MKLTALLLVHVFLGLTFLIVTVISDAFEKKIAECSTNRVRREIRDHTPQEIKSIQQAFQTLYENGVVQKFVRHHQDHLLVGHRTPIFLLFHRAILFDFEKEFLKVIKESTVTGLPYWASTRDAYSQNHSDLFSNSFLGNSDGCLSIPFGHMNDLQGHCVSRAMKNHIFLSESVAAFFIRLYNNNFFEFSKAIEEIIHDSVHIGLGGTMNDLEQSPSDPVFWFHHSYIDYVWTKWQAFPNNYFRYIVHESDPEFNSKRILGYSIPQLMDYKTTFCTAYQDPSSNVPPALPLKNAEKYVPLLTQVLFTSPEFERKFSKEKDLNWIVSKIQILENYLIHILKLGEGWPTLERPTEHEMKELNKIVEIEKNSQTQRYALSLVSFILLSFFWGTVVEIFSN